MTTSSNVPAIETSGLTKLFKGHPALDSATLSVSTGLVFGFLGPNGAGKTTLIRLLLGLTRPSAGTMSLLGHPVPEQRSEALEKVGAIVEEPRFHPFLTGRENMRIVAALRGPDAAARIDASLARVGLAEHADDKVKTYSMGMRQRLGVARCLLADPALLILDEPTNGLDPAGIQEFRSMLRLFVSEGRTVFLSSHLLNEVERICDQVAIIDRGKIIVQDSIVELAATRDHAVTIGCSDPRRAASLLADAGRAASIAGNLLRVSLDGSVTEEEQAIAAMNARLVEAGIAVYRIEIERASLEDAFLEITSRLGV
jgi:ABC-2 type transport system ATP-binding protein